MHDTMDRRRLERDEKWGEHCYDMPFIALRVGYEIQVIAPFAGALLRFRIKHLESDKQISVYYDINDALGIVGVPYYEAYAINGDTIREFDIEKILMAIYIECEGRDAVCQDFPEEFI